MLRPVLDLKDRSRWNWKSDWRAMVQCAVHVIHDMRFLVPVVPGDRLDINVKILKLAADVALVDGTVTVDETWSLAESSASRRALDTKPARPQSNA